MNKTRRIPFIKMNGAGNDFVFLSREDTQIPITSKLAQQLLDRHFGVGGDQLLVLTPGTSVTNPKLDFYNSDGSQAEMCGNGARAAAYYLHEFKGVNKDFILKTKAGPIGIKLKKGGQIEVDMGEPIFDGKSIPVKAKGEVKNHTLTVGSKKFKIHAVSMGNPHCVIFVPNVKSFPVTEWGPRIERHPFFPKRVNVEFVQIVNTSTVRARVWERGAGETLACGTGACAIGAAGARSGKLSRKININLPGGVLSTRWEANNHIFLTGPAQVAFSGTFLI